VEKRKISFSFREMNPGLPAFSPSAYFLSYPELQYTAKNIFCPEYIMGIRKSILKQDERAFVSTVSG
jgi:hypothetical protein